MTVAQVCLAQPLRALAWLTCGRPHLASSLFTLSSPAPPLLFQPNSPTPSPRPAPFSLSSPTPTSSSSCFLSLALLPNPLLPFFLSRSSLLFPPLCPCPPTPSRMPRSLFSHSLFLYLFLSVYTIFLHFLSSSAYPPSSLFGFAVVF